MSYGVLVNTCDKFEDCWIPYFKLHEIFWSDCNAKLYLNTEYKNFHYAGVNVTSLKVCDGLNKAKKITWSECLIRALDKIDDEIILYMQEDYFIKGPVENELVNNYVDLMKSDENIDCIHLTDQAVVSDGKSRYEGLLKVKRKQRYKVSCQAALWRKDVLKSLLRKHETAWQFEEFGSKRSAIINHNFYVVDADIVKIDIFEIIPYVFTGVVQGRWNEDVVPLFEKNNIEVDYNIRGFINDKPKKKFSVKVKEFFIRFPVVCQSYIDIIYLKLL